VEPAARRAVNRHAGGGDRLSGHRQALLARLETSVAIWFLLLVVYHIIRRWMLIQRRRLAFDRAKHRRAEILAQRARGEDDVAHSSSPEGSAETK
jgi:potassium efflux system protein